MHEFFNPLNINASTCNAFVFSMSLMSLYPFEWHQWHGIFLVIARVRFGNQRVAIIVQWVTSIFNPFVEFFPDEGCIGFTFRLRENKIREGVLKRHQQVFSNASSTFSNSSWSVREIIYLHEEDAIGWIKQKSPCKHQLTRASKSTRSGTWTRTAITGQRILSPSCLPFHHSGILYGERKTRLELATLTLARLCSTNWAISAFGFKTGAKIRSFHLSAKFCTRFLFICPTMHVRLLPS